MASVFDVGVTNCARFRRMIFGLVVTGLDLEGVIVIRVPPELVGFTTTLGFWSASARATAAAVSNVFVFSI